MVIRRSVASAGADPIPAAVARIAAARRVVVPFAPIDFAIAAAAAAQAVADAGENSAPEPVFADTALRVAAIAAFARATATRWLASTTRFAATR